MKVSLKSDVQKFIEEKVRSGMFNSVDEAVNVLLARVCRQEAEAHRELDELRETLQLGLSEAERGEFVDFTAGSVISERHDSFDTRDLGRDAEPRPPGGSGHE